ncbi:hypothetical protein OP10G_3494 [Fimbriimonas ginsengisoli Gsoil 348]|uniref:DUF2339 domain-containing protein n=1 Tax=Fimbriimonas ginsengisoli Gsoil 348 TaxID=661478 RepID=A0A068NU16_FIMGI|nr:hypothetical protein OP10G_3494 [Fimbriimonas ginsengisoli Gsoil 348]
MIDEATENFIGTKILPRAGAAVLVLMFAYLVSIAYEKGFIGPGTIFGGAAALCLALIGIGQWKRNERAEFGHILTGIGSCGLYFDFAGGHFFQHLYSGESVVALFVALSLVNLAYSLWKATRAFLAIGMTGGLVAALLPLQGNQPEMAAGLFFLILVSAAFVAARNKWADASLGLWLAAALSAIPIALNRASTWPLGVGTLEIAGLIGLAAFCWSSRRPQATPAIAAAAATLLTGIGAFALHPGLQGAGHIVAFSLAAAAVSLLAPDQAFRSTLIAGAAATALWVAPFGLERTTTLLLLPSLGALCCVAALKVRMAPCLVLAGAEMVLSLVPYTILIQDRGIEPRIDALYLLIVVVTCFAASSLARKIGEEAETIFLFGLGVALGRGAYLALTTFGLLGPTFAFTAAALLGSFVALAFGFVRNFRSLRMGSIAALALTMIKVVLYDLAQASQLVRVAILLILGIGLLGAGYWYIRRDASRSS